MNGSFVNVKLFFCSFDFSIKTCHLSFDVERLILSLVSIYLQHAVNTKLMRPQKKRILSLSFFFIRSFWCFCLTFFPPHFFLIKASFEFFCVFFLLKMFWLFLNLSLSHLIGRRNNAITFFLFDNSHVYWSEKKETEQHKGGVVIFIVWIAIDLLSQDEGKCDGGKQSAKKKKEKLIINDKHLFAFYNLITRPPPANVVETRLRYRVRSCCLYFL